MSLRRSVTDLTYVVEQQKILIEQLQKQIAMYHIDSIPKAPETYPETYEAGLTTVVKS